MNKILVFTDKSFGALMFVVCLTFGLIMNVQNVYSQTDSDGKQGIKVSDAKVVNMDENINSPYGYWQYPNRAVWVYIDGNNEAFQCRIDKDDTIYKSYGTLIEEKEISWEEIWGKDTLKVKNGKLSLKGKYGEFSLVRVSQISDSRCFSEPYGNLLTLPDGVGTGGGVGRGGGFGSGVGEGRGNGDGDGDGPGMGSGRGTGSGAGDGSSPNVEKPTDPKGENRSLKILSKPAPGYTKEARTNNVQGIVRLRVTFLANGSIGSITPVQGLPNGLTEKAIAAARQIKFEPAMKNGKPISVTKLFEYSFVIY